MFPLDVNNSDVSGIHAITVVSYWNISSQLFKRLLSKVLRIGVSSHTRACTHMCTTHTLAHNHVHTYIHTAVIEGITIFLCMVFKKQAGLLGGSVSGVSTIPLL